ncbi:MAG TPA: hypothetical protein VK724_00835 [Bryobacteraceae bacterium]|jgi:hypothetical protein|nr:hypothetical protein [Bryobacteraceae bacterium]
MTKLFIAIAFLTVAIAAGGNASKQMAPQTIQADFPIPSCPPACAVPTPSQIPDR